MTRVLIKSDNVYNTLLYKQQYMFVFLQIK